MEHENPEQFFADLEQTYGGSVLYKSFAMFHTLRDGRYVKLGGLLYFISSSIVFEDFEKEQKVFGVLMRDRSGPYEKFRAEETVDAVEQVQLVMVRQAEQFLKGNASRSQLYTPAPLERFFMKTAQHLAFSNGNDWFLEPMNSREFTSYLNSVMQHR